MTRPLITSRKFMPHNYSLEKLNNGIRLLSVPQKNTQAVTILAFFPVGSRYESKKINGISHFIEHLMFKGTTRRPTSFDLTRELDSMGADYNAFTGKDHTGYYIKVSKHKAEAALDLLEDMLWHSLFDAAEIEREKGVVIEEINMYTDNPTMVIEEYFEELMYPGNPLGWYIGGTPDVIKSITRDEIISYRNHFYQPQKMLLTVAGAVAADFIGRVKNNFKSVRQEKTSVAAPVFSKVKLKKSTRVEERFLLKYKETDQAHLVLGFLGLNYDDERGAAYNVLNTILGTTMSSRLFIAVREKRGLAYMIRSGANPYKDVGNFSIQAGLDKSRIDEAIKVILEEVHSLMVTGPTEEEVQRAKDYLSGRTILSLEDSSALANWYAKQAALMKRIETPQEKIAKLQKVTAKEVAKVAADVFKKDELRLVVLGPYKDTERFLKLMV